MLQRLLHRWLSIFLFFFAFTCLSFPQMCCDERSDIGQSSHSETAFACSNDSTNQRSSNQSTSDTDCFCCCSHILPGLHFDVASLGAGLPENDLTNPLLPSPSPQNTFHPPRFS